MAWRYKDKETGLYVTRAKWASGRGTKRYVRVNEKWGSGKRLPKPKPPIKAIGNGPIVERLRYQEADKRRSRDIEIISDNGKVQSVRVGSKVYSNPADLIQFKSLVESARIEGTEISEKQFRSNYGRPKQGS